MPVTSINTKTSQIVPPKGKRVIEYVGRFVGSTGAVIAAQSSQGITCSAPSSGVYTVTLPGKGGMVFMGATGAVLDSASEVRLGNVLVSASSDANRTVDFTHTEDDGTSGVPIAADLAATEDLWVRILVAQL